MRVGGFIGPGANIQNPGVFFGGGVGVGGGGVGVGVGGVVVAVGAGVGDGGITRDQAEVSPDSKPSSKIAAINAP